MKNLKAMSSVVLAVSLAFGMNVCAAESSTTTNTNASAITQQEQQHVLERGSSSTTTRAAVTTTTSGETVRVAADYSAVSIPNKSTGASSSTAAAGTHKGTVTVYPADTKTYNALQEYVNTVASGKQVIASGVRFRMYDGKTSIKNGFGTFTAKVGVGAKYNGKTATAYIYAIDGTVTAVPVTIVNGQAVVPMEVMGVVTIVLD